MPNWREVPKWKFGEILVLDDSRGPRSARVMFLGWVYHAPSDPTEAIFRGLVLEAGPEWTDKPGDIVRPYCGWWMPDA